MAEFLIGSPLRKVARKHPVVARALWRLDYWLVKAVVMLCQALPVDTASRLGRLVGATVGPWMRKKSAIVAENLAVAFPEQSPDERRDLIRRMWGQAGRLLAEYPHLAEIGGDPVLIEIDLLGASVRLARAERPGVFVSAHQGNWEVVILAMARLGIESTTLYSPPTNPLLDNMLLESRRALRCDLIPRDNSARAMMRALGKGRAVAMVMDRRVDSGDDIDLFGQPKKTTLLPARLALKYHCHLTPVEVRRLDGARFRIIFHPPVAPRNPEADEDAQAADMLNQVHRYFEQWISANPADWFCSKRLWPKHISGRENAGKGPAEVGVDDK